MTTGSISFPYGTLSMRINTDTGLSGIATISILSSVILQAIYRLPWDHRHTISIFPLPSWSFPVVGITSIPENWRRQHMYVHTNWLFCPLGKYAVAGPDSISAKEKIIRPCLRPRLYERRVRLLNAYIWR